MKVCKINGESGTVSFGEERILFLRKCLFIFSMEAFTKLRGAKEQTHKKEICPMNLQKEIAM